MPPVKEILMPSENVYTRENKAAREHLKAFVSQLSDQDLTHPMPAGWTVSAVLAHLAFWDYRALTLVDKWQKDGVGPSPIDTELVNEVTRILCLAIPPREAAEMALKNAAAVDQAIDQLAPEMIAEIETNGKTVHLNRAAHRRLHIEEINQALGKK
jgi:hypothetical protein